MGGALAGAALSTAGGAHAATPAKARKPGPVIAKDGTELFVRDWGTGRPIVFLATTLPCLTRKTDNPNGVPPAYFDQMRKQFYADFPKWIDDNAEPFVTPSTSPLMKTWIKGMMLSATLQAALALNKTMTASDFRAELARLAVPTLYIHGDKDASSPLPISAGPAAALTPGARVVIYEGAPHGLFVTHIEKLNADIAAFARG